MNKNKYIFNKYDNTYLSIDVSMILYQTTNFECEIYVSRQIMFKYCRDTQMSSVARKKGLGVNRSVRMPGT